MKQVFRTELFKRMLMYFLLAVAIICAYKIILEVDAIFNAIKQLMKIISPFIIGFILAYVLNIPCSGIEKLLSRIKNKFIVKIRKLLSIFLTYLLLVLLLSLILLLVIPSVYRSAYLFAADYQTYYDSVEGIINYINDLNILNIDINMEKFISIIRDFGLEKLPSSLSAILAVPYALLSGFLTLISSVYILAEKENFKKYLSRLLKAFFPEAIYTVVIKRAFNLNMHFKKYIYTQTIDGCILGTIATIELYLLGSRYALTIGIMLGLVNYVPYFGSIVGSIVAVIVVAFTQGIPIALLTGLILLITQQIDGNIIQPKLMGDSFSLSPLLVIISITVGGALAGVLGMLVAIPIVATLKNILDDIIAYYEQQKLAESNETEVL